MAEKRIPGDGLSDDLTGMSKSQLYDIMSQMKMLIEQNQMQAREILVQNPMLTKALFQAQVMLGMVQPSPVMPSIQPSVSQRPPQAKLAAETSLQDQKSVPQIQVPARKHQQNQPAMPASTPSLHAADFHSQSMPSQPLPTVRQHKGHPPLQVTSTQSTQIPSLPPLQPAAQPPSLLRPQLNTISREVQQSSQTNNISRLPLQQQFPPHRPLPSMPALSHQFPSQMGPNMGFQHPGGPHPHHSQPMFHPGNRPQAGIGSSFSHGQPPHSRQGPAQPMYPVGNPMLADRGAGWMGGQAENTKAVQFPGLPPKAPGNPPPLTAEMEKALLQQVMSLTQEQINLLPPDQRHQVVQLQQILSHSQ